MGTLSQIILKIHMLKIGVCEILTLLSYKLFLIHQIKNDKKLPFIVKNIPFISKIWFFN